MKQYIYADFNGISSDLSDSEYTYLDICGYGTLASLSSKKIQLTEGMQFIFFEPGDIEVEAEVCFLKEHTDKNNPLGKWYAKYKTTNIGNSNTSAEHQFTHLCFSCEFNLDAYLTKVGKQYKEFCPECGTSIMYPLSPPAVNKSLNQDATNVAPIS